MANSNGGIVGVDNVIVPGATALTSTFNSTGTFTAQAGTTEVEYLVIAGAGGGGGGGGAGGFRTATGLSVTGGSSIPVTVGAAGAGGPAANGESGKGSKGSNSVFSSITSTGGGYGGGGGGLPNVSPGGPGGSGGGGGCSYYQPNEPLNSQPGAGNEGGFSPVEGYEGAAGGLYYWTGGGGGGSGAVGGPSYQPAAGTPSTISGSDVTYALGGGGAGQGAGGANTGTGGGGGGDNGAGPSGGSGVVFIKEAEVIGQASGIWDMYALYDNVKAGTWTT
jgi:hypothetical protein